MTTNYFEEFKARIIARLLPPNNARVNDVAQETGIRSFLGCQGQLFKNRWSGTAAPGNGLRLSPSIR